MSRRTGESICEDDATYWVVTGILEEQSLLVTFKMDEGMHGDQYTNKENIIYRRNTEGYLPMREEHFE